MHVVLERSKLNRKKLNNTGWRKKTSQTFAGVSSSAIDRFLKILHYYIQR